MVMRDHSNINNEGEKMIKRSFTWADDDSYGMTGWVPDFIPNANVSSDFGLVHDVMEHLGEQRGTFEDEIRALGAMIYTRILGGYFYRGYTFRTQEEMMLLEVTELVNQMAWVRSSKLLKEAPPTKVYNEDLSWLFSEIKAMSRKHFKDEIAEAITLSNYKENILRAIGWLRLGFVQARSRYYHANPYEVEGLFQEIKTAVNKPNFKHGEYGDKLVISINPKQLRFNVKYQEFRGEY